MTRGEPQVKTSGSGPDAVDDHNDKRRKDKPTHIAIKGLECKARIPTGDLIPKTRRCRNKHSMAFQVPSASVEEHKCSFFPQTIRDLNGLPDSLITSDEMPDDCVSKFMHQ